MKLFSHTTLSIRKSLLLLFFVPASGLLLTAQIGDLKVVKEEPVFVSASGEDVHIVKKGETLFAISKKYNVIVDDILKTNDMSSPKILLGQRLVIPSTATQMSRGGMNQRVAGGTDTRGIDASTRKIVQERPIYYTVKRGDDIFSISDTEEKTVAQLKEWNPTAKFKEGERVVVGKRYEEVALSVAPTPTTISNQRIAQPSNQRIASPANTMVPRGIVTPRPVTRSAPTGDLGSLVAGSTMNPPAMQPQVTNSIQQTQRMRSATPPVTSVEGLTYDLPQLNNYGQMAISQVFGEVKDDRIQTTRFYAHHKTLPLGTKVNLMIPDNAGFIQVEIVGRLAQNSTADIGLSPDIISIITGATQRPSSVMITYN